VPFEIQQRQSQGIERRCVWSCVLRPLTPSAFATSAFATSASFATGSFATFATGSFAFARTSREFLQGRV
jgi:hypothetical protein